MRPQWFDRRDYDTRMDRFRASERISIHEWAKCAAMKRSQLNKYRAGTEPRTDTIARLVRSAAEILGRPVRASELFDLGEEVAVGSHDPNRETPPRNEAMRKQYPSRLDALIRALDIPPQAFAQRVGLSRRQLARLRSDKASASIATVRRIVVTLREQGHDVLASDIADVGEDPGRE